MKQAYFMRRWGGVLRCIWTCVLCCGPLAGSAQMLPLLQPEQDACDALVLCGNSFHTPYSYAGVGRIMEVGSPIQEDNSMWLRLNVNTPGTIVFTISPVNIFDDYDFAVFDITNASCSSFTLADAVRYNFKNNYGAPLNGMTGLSDTSTVHFVSGGSSVYPFCQYINAAAGDVYLIMVNNWRSSGVGISAGFTLDFAGSTATFNQPPAPKFTRISSSCNYRDVVVDLDQPVLCSSIAIDGSDFSVSPSGTVLAAAGVGCSGSQGYVRQVKLTMAVPVANGNYRVHARRGTDGNTLQSLCGVELQLPDALDYSVNVGPMQYVRLDSPACQVLTVYLNKPATCASIATDGSDFSVTGPSPVSVVSASGAPGCVQGGTGGITNVIRITLSAPIAVDGIYNLVARTGSDGNVLLDSCGVEQLPGDIIPFTVNSFNGKLRALPDTVVCAGIDSVRLYGVNTDIAPNGGFSYRWVSANKVRDSLSADTWGMLSAEGGDFILETRNRAGCYLRDSARIRFSPPSEVRVLPQDPAVCPGVAVQLQATGGASYRWYDNAAFNALHNTILSCRTCPDPLVTPAAEGQQPVYLIAVDTYGCRDTVITMLTVHPAAKITVDPPEATVPPGGTVQLHASGAADYTWTPARYLDDPRSPDPQVQVITESTVYTVTGVSEFGCPGSAEVRVRVSGTFPDMMPTAFTPNGDGRNDIYRVVGVTTQHLQDFRIFNRWGGCVFRTADITRGWDGVYNGAPAEPGTYFYLVRLLYRDGATAQYQGNFVLVR